MIQETIRLPKELESTPEGEEISRLLFGETSSVEKVRLWSGSSSEVPVIRNHPQLQQALFFARGNGHVLRSYDQILLELERGQRGLERLQKKTGQAASNRLSRIVFVTNDAADRLYRRCDDLLARHGNRILLCKLDLSSEELGHILYGKPKNVKVIMVTHKISILHILQSLFPEE